MWHTWIFATIALVSPDLPAHDRNPVLRATIDEGLAIGEVRVKLPEATFRDGQTAEGQRAALVEVAGSSRGADEMLQPSISAPHRLRIRDVQAEGATVRAGDIYFILRGVDLDAIEPEEAFRQLGGEPTEAGNMRFEVRVLKADDFKDPPTALASGHEWLTHANGRLLDRIAVESTDRVVTSRSADSLVFAARTDPSFGPKTPFPNRWSTITLKATGDVLGPPEPYAGGIGYVKMTRLKGLEGAVAVEIHFAFAEPRAWFDGAPILRSKFGLIAQDQVRRLRRELLKPKR
jgi:hypothetical protein